MLLNVVRSVKFPHMACWWLAEDCREINSDHIPWSMAAVAGASPILKATVRVLVAS